jgi:hypothetical protein
VSETAAGAAAGDADLLAPGELDRLAATLAERFAPHVQAASAAVREAETELAEARAALARAEQAAAGRRYASDRLVFMRAGVRDEVEGLSRKTTPKKVRVAFRYLLARSVELAEGEVAGYRSDQAEALRDRLQGVEACREIEAVALTRLEAALAMQTRVLSAEQAARDGLAVLVEKLTPAAERRPG